MIDPLSYAAAQMLGLTIALSAEERLNLPTVTIMHRAQTRPVVDAAVDVIRMDPELTAARHPNTILDQAAGTWVSRGSGQEHLTAIRSPVLTGAGACGAFAFLDDGLAVRPPGFCNVNQLFEVNLAQAGTVEVLRGPGGLVHGSNALHGAINAIPKRWETDHLAASVTLGGEDHREARLEFGSGPWSISSRLVSADDFRADAGFDQQFINIDWQAQANTRLSIAASNLNQETAGFIFGEDAYRDPAIRRTNPNPEAFRDARALRAALTVDREVGAWQVQAKPFIRSSEMRFLQHFLPGQPLEENAQDSLGIYLSGERSHERGDWRLGLDLDIGQGELRQTQDGPTISGSAFLRETRPAGNHYDYDVDMATAALFGGGRWDLADRWDIEAGVRVESTHYDYDNHLAAGNLRDDGTACGFGGCLYTRPSDRDDSFTSIAPKVSLGFQRSDRERYYLRAARGFRAPQVTELYRLQNGQTVTDLDDEVMDQWELGGTWNRPHWHLAFAAFYGAKEDSIIRDSEGFNVSGAKSRHRGIELSTRWYFHDEWSLDIAATLAEHRYGSFPATAEPIAPGNHVDTAPQTIGAATVRGPAFGGDIVMQWRHLGGYWLDAANEHRYGGHDLLHATWRKRLSPHWSGTLEVRNLTNARYAERADFAFGNYRYFPDAGRTAFVTLRWRR